MKRDDQPLIGESPVFLTVLEEVSRAAGLDRPVLIVGERGTGKELIAERLHFLSHRWDQPLVPVNCAAISESLLESELFGHEAGAFTDAQSRRIGRFELADAGTLFLDELATTSPAIQEKILRIIEDGRFERLGGSETLEIDVRVIGATNEDLPSLAHRGRFRADLLDRLAFDVITLPPLRHRPEDIELLAEHFAMRMSRELGRELFAGFSPAARRALLAHPWPGNVRELKNVVERAVYRQEDVESPVEHIQFDPFDSPWRPQAGAANAADGNLPDPRAKPIDLRSSMKELEVRLIRQALEFTDGNQRRAAARLGLTYHQLRGMVRKHGIGGSEDNAAGGDGQ